MTQAEFNWRIKDILRKAKETGWGVQQIIIEAEDAVLEWEDEQKTKSSKK